MNSLLNGIVGIVIFTVFVTITVCMLLYMFVFSYILYRNRKWENSDPYKRFREGVEKGYEEGYEEGKKNGKKEVKQSYYLQFKDIISDYIKQNDMIFERFGDKIIEELKLEGKITGELIKESDVFEELKRIDEKND